MRVPLGTAFLVVGLLFSSGASANDADSEAYLELMALKMKALIKQAEILEKQGKLDAARAKYAEAVAVFDGLERRPERVERLPFRPDVRKSIEMGLAWLVKHQDDDGRWDADNFAKHDPNNDKSDGRGGTLYDVGVSGLALLALMQARDPQVHEASIERGLTFLFNQQDTEGCFGARSSQHFMYNTAIATAAMCEGFRRTKNLRWKKSATAGITFLLQARNPYLAWRYEPRAGENDTSITGWCVEALRRARRARLPIGAADFDAAIKGSLAWVDKMTDPNTGRTGYQRRGGPPARPEGKQNTFPAHRSESLTASGIVTKLTAGRGKNAPDIQSSLRLLLGRRPSKGVIGGIDLYYWYWATLACRRVGGSVGRTWDDKALATIASLQHKKGSGSRTGSWDPVGPWANDGGRVYSTALMVMALQEPTGGGS
ncbi:MAG: prenyltransferase/squalene oxidase repeat-containing protein [Planctomycetota bacterium]